MPGKRIQQEPANKPGPPVQAINVLLAAALLLLTAVWLIALAAGEIDLISQVLRPHLPSWFSLANALLVPVTCGLAASRLVSFRISLLLVLAMLAQVSVLGLTAKDHPYVNAAVTILLYYESFVLIPNWNRRILEKKQDGSVLGLSSGKGQ